MPDIYLTITAAEHDVLEQLIKVLEVRAADPQQQAMRNAYFADLRLPPAARVLEVGCGSGAVTRALRAVPNVAEAMGVDPSPHFVERARALAAGIPGITFEVADGTALPFADGSFDAVIFHTVLCHIPSPERALAEARRVVRVGGQVAIFDGDYATTTVAIGPSDPLQACADAAMEAFVHDRWLVRRLPRLVEQMGFTPQALRGYSLIETHEGYILTTIERGVTALVAAGRITQALGAALAAEARQRIHDGRFFGHVAYASMVVSKADMG